MFIHLALHFQPWLFLPRLDDLLTRELSLVPSLSSLQEKSHSWKRKVNKQKAVATDNSPPTSPFNLVMELPLEWPRRTPEPVALYSWVHPLSTLLGAVSRRQAPVDRWGLLLFILLSSFRHHKAQTRKLCLLWYHSATTEVRILNPQDLVPKVWI